LRTGARSLWRACKRNGPGSFEPGPSLISPRERSPPKLYLLATRGLDQLADGVHALVDRLQRFLGDVLDQARNRRDFRDIGFECALGVVVLLFSELLDRLRVMSDFVAAT
jgi:hypothetical protein